MRFISYLMGAVCTSVFCLFNCNAASNPCPISADLWVLAGQSNMQGYAVLREQTQPDPRIMMLNMDNHWIVALEPVHRIWQAKAPVHRNLSLLSGYTEEQILEFEEKSKTHPVGGVGPGLFFAQHLVANGISAVGLVPSAHGGTTMDQWSPTLKDLGDESLYGAMINRIKMVGGNIKGLLWYQGESDTDGTATAYEEKMLNFIDCLRKDMNNPDLPIIMVQLGRYCANNQPDSKGWEMEKVRDIQRQLPLRRKNVYMVVASDLPLDDVIHISFEGQNILGRRLAEVALSYVYKKPNHGRQINLESVEVVNAPMPMIKLRFNGVSGKLLAAGRPADFEVRVLPTDDPYIVSYKTEFDKEDPQAIIVKLQKPPTETTQLVYGGGLNSYVNIVDEAGMAVPAFGPIDLPPIGKMQKYDP